MTALLPLLLLGCRPDPPPDVFLFTVDTLRADHMGTYGYERDTTPWIDALGEEGIVFEEAYSTASWTVPGAAATIFSAYPWQLGLEESTPPGSSRPVLPIEAVSVAAVFRAHGYRTEGYVANGHLSPDRGWNRGFDVYENVGFSDRDAITRAMRRSASTTRRRAQPVFVWVHLFDPHEPYGSGLAFAETWTPEVAEQLGTPRMDRMLMKALRVDPRFAAGRPEVKLLEALYDGEIRATDAYLARLYKTLGVGDEDVVVFASDHGEEFREHGRLGHHGPLWRETTRVPLIVRAPGVAPGRRTETVSLVDIPSTLAAAAGLEASPDWVGQDLRETASGPRFLQLGPYQAVLADGFKWLRTTTPRGTSEVLYRMDAEDQDILAGSPDRAAELRAHWATRTFPRWEPMVGQVDEERTMLEAMGYVER